MDQLLHCVFAKLTVDTTMYKCHNVVANLSIIAYSWK